MGARQPVSVGKAAVGLSWHPCRQRWQQGAPHTHLSPPLRETRKTTPMAWIEEAGGARWPWDSPPPPPTAAHTAAAPAVPNNRHSSATPPPNTRAVCGTPVSLHIHGRHLRGRAQGHRDGAASGPPTERLHAPPPLIVGLCLEQPSVPRPVAGRQHPVSWAHPKDPSHQGCYSPHMRPGGWCP